MPAVVVFGLLSWGFMKLVLTRRYVRAVPGFDLVRLVSVPGGAGVRVSLGLKVIAEIN